MSTEEIRASDMAVDSNGVFYFVTTVIAGSENRRLVLYRSTDSGESWSLWHTFEDPTPGVDLEHPCLHIAEGDANRIFMAYRVYQPGSQMIQVAWSPLGGAADFNVVTVESGSGLYNAWPDLTSDATAFSGYYLYIAYAYHSGDDSAIRFARSTDMGDSWETPYSVGSLSMSDRYYGGYPKVAYGYGRYVHVAWDFRITSDIYDYALRYRRVPNFADGGLPNWEPILGPTPITNGWHETLEDLTASQASNQVIMGYDIKDMEFSNHGSGIVVSEDQGASWEEPLSLIYEIYHLGDVAQNPDDGRWFVSGKESYSSGNKAGFMSASPADLTAWDHYSMEDDGDFHVGTNLVLDPTHGHQVALSMFTGNSGEGWVGFLFDGQWRGDPGYPNHEVGFPVDLSHGPVSDPALVDLNGNGDLEIVFGDDGGNIQVFKSDGNPLPGWPVNVGTGLSNAPIAIGDLNDDGQMLLLAGTQDGRVFGFNPDGTPAPGWPFDTGEPGHASVNIGHLGPPYPRLAVVIAGAKMQILNNRGMRAPGTDIWTSSSSFGSGAAIGDVDGDETIEIVYRSGQIVLSTDPFTGSVEIYRGIGTDLSNTPTLGDFDLDGDMDIVVSTYSGVVYLLNDDGTNFPGAWSNTIDINVPLSKTAISHCFSTWEPEIAVNSRDWKSFLIQHDGSYVPGFPVETTTWYIWGGPIIGRVNETAPGVIFGARGNNAWAFRNNGTLIEGWPKDIANHCYNTPAMGDMDLDGRNEIVFLTMDQLVVLDTNTPYMPAVHTWLMSGHDHQRTGCSDCPENLVTAAPDDQDAVTRVSFSAPAPNPVSGNATFSYAVPLRAVVELAVYDLRGRRVALIHREEAEAGRHVITWNGRDGRGRRLASGNYIAALKVRGPGLDEMLKRKVVVLH
jgi:hypothetical protein